MILVYRRNAAEDSLDLDWHFHTQCSRWPELEFVQIIHLRPNETERLCQDCAKLESKMSPTQE